MNRHLNDNEIQEIIEGIIPADAPAALHLDTCAQCRKAAANYRALFTALDRQPDFTLSSAFADKVMDGLPQSAPITQSEEKHGVRDSILVFGTFAAILAAVIYFFNPLSLMDSITAESHSLLGAGSELLAYWDKIANAFPVDPLLVVFAFLTIGIIAAIDHFLADRKQHHKPVTYTFSI